MQNWKLGWKTLTGAGIAALGYLCQPNVLAVMPPKVASIVQAIGAMLAVYGMRDAIAKVSP